MLADSDIDKKIQLCFESQKLWAMRPLSERQAALEALGKALLEHKESLSSLITKLMGKPIRQSRAEIEKSALLCDYYAKNAQELLAPQLLESDSGRCEQHLGALGLVLGIMPWNFPVWQVVRYAVPSLLVGNGVLLKHAELTFQMGAELEKIFASLNFPKGLFTDLSIEQDQVKAVIEDERIAAVTLTGSERAGRAVATIAGACLKKCVLELGGSDPYLFLEDCDLESAVRMAFQARMINAGQSCVAAKRWIVHRSLFSELRTEVLRLMKSLKVGDPREESTDLGPLARQDLCDTVRAQVNDSLAAGAKLEYQLEIPHREGHYFAPCVLSRVQKGMPVYEEEVFGPVVCLLEATDEKQAIKLANDTRFGLGAAVFSQDTQRARRVLEQIHSGMGFINDFVRSDPRWPFGGIKASGFGRELGAAGLLEFSNQRTVYSAEREIS